MTYAIWNDRSDPGPLRPAQRHLGRGAAFKGRQISAAGPLGAALSRDIDQWWRYWNETWNVPHDPVTVLALAQPELFELSQHESYPHRARRSGEGHSTFVDDPTGTSRLVIGLNAPAVTEAMIDGIRGAVEPIHR